MGTLTENYFIYLCIFLSILKSVNSINCYQCSGTDSEHPFECNEFLETDTNLAPNDCASIHNAQYCIKHVGRFEGTSIECFQCNSSTSLECSDGLINLDGGILKPTSCEHVYNAKYCIKLTGGISTKRYCSSLDLGNFCNYVQQIGDKLEYRTCIYTCSTDGCNAAATMKISAVLVMAVAIKSLALYPHIATFLGFK